MHKATAVLPPPAPQPPAAEAVLREAVVARATALASARIRESPQRGNNRGEPFDTYNRSAGVPLGSPYCVSLWHYELGRVFAAQGFALPIRVGASTSRLAARAKQAGRLKLAEQAQPGDLLLFRNAAGNYFHTGLVTARRADGRLRTVEGNTSPSARVVGEGGGIYARLRDPRQLRCESVDLCAPPFSQEPRVPARGD